MSPQRLESELRDLLGELTRPEASSAELDADLVRELGLDSLARLRLLAGVEKRLSVRFPDARLAELRTLRQLIEAIERVQDGGMKERNPARSAGCSASPGPASDGGVS